MYSSRQADTYAGESRAVHYKGTPKHYGVQPAADTKAIMSLASQKDMDLF